MNLEVQFDGKAIYKASFPLCHVERSAARGNGAEKRLTFSFKPPRKIVWLGYREEDNTTKPMQAITGDIWLAGADPDAMLLGVSFMTTKSIYMNTIHVAYPTQRKESEIAPGLVVITSPVDPVTGERK